MILETERTIIRKFELADLDDLHQIFSDDKIMQHVEEPYSKEKTKNFLESFCIEKNGALACIHKGTNKVIGYILFNEYESDVYEIGWIFNKEFWRQGYAYEACKALVDYAFSEMKVHKIFAEAIDVEKSVPLMEKLGMVREGVQRKHTLDSNGNWVDFYLYGILEKDYFANL